MVLRPLTPVSLDEKSEITCRRQLREFEREHGVERIGLEYTGEEKPEWWDQYKDNRREREARAKQDKALPEVFKPPAVGRKVGGTNGPA